VVAGHEPWRHTDYRDKFPWATVSRMKLNSISPLAVTRLFTPVSAETRQFRKENRYRWIKHLTLQIHLFVINLASLWEARLHSVEWRDDELSLEKDLEGNGQELTTVLSLYLPGRVAENLEFPPDSRCSGQDSNLTPPAHESRVLPLY
jgi:hypothetical protein